MADTKISDMPVKTPLEDADMVPVASGDENHRTTIGAIKAEVLGDIELDTLFEQVDDLPELEALDIDGTEMMAVLVDGVPHKLSLYSLAVYLDGDIVSPPPAWTVDPSISGPAEVGLILTGSDGTIVFGTVSGRQWRRNGVDIVGATSATYLLVDDDVGANITYRVTATGDGGVASATSLAAGPVTGYPLPAFSTAKYDGDSRTAANGRRIVNSNSCTVQSGLGDVGMIALTQALCGNKWLLGEGYQHGVGATSTLGQYQRSQSTSIASTGNPANASTGLAADVKYSENSDGVATILTQAGNHVFSASVGVNDNGGTAGAYYNTPSTAWETIAVISDIADAIGAADKVWYVGNEFPRGDSYYTMESHAVASNTCTATHTTNFVDGEQFGAVGAIGVFAAGAPRPLTKVSSAPAQDEYTVTSGGLYTFGGTAPTTAFINYNASPTSPGRQATYDQLRIINEWMMSDDPNFVSAINSVDYTIPGLRYDRPWVRVVDTFAAYVDPASGGTQLALPGTSDILQLHGLSLGHYIAATAFKDKIDADYPSAPDISTAPTRNNWYSAAGNGSLTTFSGTLPVSMRTGFTTTPAPTLISINGVPVGKVDTGTGAITGTGITTGTLDFATGAWSITFASSTSMPASSQLWFEQDIGDFDLATMTEGDIGRNCVNNGLLDMTAASGTGIGTAGVSGLTGIANSDVPWGWTCTGSALQTAITNGTVVVSAGTETVDGYPRWFIDLAGIHTAAAIPTLGSGTLNNFGQKVTVGDKIIGGAQVSYEKHGTIGHCYGNNGAGVTASFSTAAVTRQSPTGPQTGVIVMTTRVQDSGLNLFVDELALDAAGGALDLYRITPQLDTTGCTFSSPALNIIAGRTQANMPGAFRVGLGRAQVRRRNDV